MHLAISLLLPLLLLLTGVLYAGERSGIWLGHVAFGEVSYRLTNIYNTDYSFFGGWLENRLSLNGLPLIEKAKLSPYIKLTIALSNKVELPEENTLVAGVGLESRVLQSIFEEDSPGWISWLWSTRFYSEYLWIRFMRTDAGEWVPRDDFRVGLEVWKEFNVDLTARNMHPSSLQDILWSELWTDVSWRRSQFFLDDYRSWTGSLLLRLGVRVPNIDEDSDIFLMPYMSSELSITQWNFFWQNRFVVGAGAQVMPFQHAENEWLSRLRISAEYLRVVSYFQDEAVRGTPGYDVRFAVNLSKNLWK